MSLLPDYYSYATRYPISVRAYPPSFQVVARQAARSGVSSAYKRRSAVPLGYPITQASYVLLWG